jgi:hypothetical protein
MTAIAAKRTRSSLVRAGDRQGRAPRFATDGRNIDAAARERRS